MCGSTAPTSARARSRCEPRAGSATGLALLLPDRVTTATWTDRVRPRPASHLFKTNVGFRLAADVRLRPVECRRLPRAVVESFRGGRPVYFENGRSPNASSKSDFGDGVHSAVSTYEPGAIPSERLHPKGANSRIRPTAVRRSRDLSARQPPFAGTRRGMSHWNLRQSEAWQHPREPQVSHRRGRARNVRHLCHAADDRTFQHARRRPATA